MNKKEFYRKLQLFNVQGKKIPVCWRIYCVLVERKEAGITDPISKANLAKLTKITNWSMMLARLVDMVNAGIINDNLKLVGYKKKKNNLKIGDIIYVAFENLPDNLKAIFPNGTTFTYQGEDKPMTLNDRIA